MGYYDKTPLEKAQYTNETKTQIITALNNKGFGIENSDSFRDIPTKISNNTVIIDTSTSSTSIIPEYSSTDFILNPETGYYEYSGKWKTAELDITFTNTQTEDITLNYEGSGLLGDAAVYVKLDDTNKGDLMSEGVYTDFIISDVVPGTHVVSIMIPSMLTTTTLKIKMIPIQVSETPITANTVLSGGVGFINGSKVIGSYVPLDTSDANATASDIASGKSGYINGSKVNGSVNVVESNNTISGTYSSDTNNVYLKTGNTDNLFRSGSGLKITKSSLANEIELSSDKLLNGTSVLGITGNSNNINTTVGSETVSPTYSATNFTENTETGYWLYDSELYAIGEITMTIDLPSESNLVLSYKGTRLSTAMSGNDVYLDNTKIGSLDASSELTTYTINSVSSGTHTIKVCIDSDRPDTTLEICMEDVTIISTPITANTVLSGGIGFVNGQKIVGTYIPLDTSDANAIAGNIDTGKTAYVNGVKITGTSTKIDTSTVSEEVELSYTSDGTCSFILDQETGYWGRSWVWGNGEFGTLYISFTTTLTQDLTLSYKATNVNEDVYLDDVSQGTLVDSNDYIDFVLSNVQPGTHTVKVNGKPNGKNTETIFIKMLPILEGETPITANTILNGSVGFVNGQKIVGTYVPTIVNEYNSIAAMEADTTAVANHTYGIEKRTRPIYTYTSQEYNSTVNSNTGFYCLDILESFITSSTITSSSYQSLSDDNNNVDFTYSGLSLSPTSAEIKIVDYNNNVLIDAIYASQDGENYTLTSLTGNNVDQTTYKFYLENGHIQMSRNRGEGPTPSYSDLFNDFFKPQIRTQGQETYNGALYLYNGSTWDKLIDQDN